jgi:DNA-binding transcriptional ArsR family regulator
MSDKITLDRDTFKALAADTRVDILKKLGERKLTLTDLSEQMDMSPSTIKEHLDRLVEVGLIEADDRGMKWKYYRLTNKGRNIVSPNETKVWILLGTTLLVLMGSTLSLAAKMAFFISPAAPLAAQYAATAGVAENSAPAPFAGDKGAVSSAGTPVAASGLMTKAGVTEGNAESAEDLAGVGAAVNGEGDVEAVSLAVRGGADNASGGGPLMPQNIASTGSDGLSDIGAAPPEPLAEKKDAIEPAEREKVLRREEAPQKDEEQPRHADVSTASDAGGAPEKPYFEVALIALSLPAAAACMAYLVRKRMRTA